MFEDKFLINTRKGRDEVFVEKIILLKLIRSKPNGSYSNRQKRGITNLIVRRLLFLFVLFAVYLYCYKFIWHEKVEKVAFLLYLKEYLSEQIILKSRAN